MSRGLSRTLSLTVAIVCLTAGLSMGKTQWLYGSVTQIKLTRHLLTITTVQGEVRTFTVVPKLLETLKPGHEIDLEIVDGKVKSIYNWNAQGT